MVTGKTENSQLGLQVGAEETHWEWCDFFESPS